jgi:putative DNA primase/helicase
VAPPGTPKARKSPPDLAVVDDTGAVRKPRLEITVDPDQLPAFSEFALAKAFADGPGVDWRYTAAWGLWAKWNSIRWVQDEKKLITWEARNCCAAVMQEHLADSTPAQRMKVATFKTTNAVIGLALADPRIATGAAQWDADPWLLGTPAGIVDLRTGKTVPPDKTQFISKSTLVAPAEGTHPLFDMVIARPGTGEGMLEFLWRWLGYILSGDVREERFLFLHGLGNSGKGTLIKVIADILGDYAKVVAIQAFTESQHQRHSQEIAKLQGARFVYASETEEGSRFDEAMLKWLTGRDKITAHKMRQDDIEFYPQFKLLIYGNNRPSLKSVGEDMRRRIDLIEFPGTIPESERDATLKDRLREEYPAILASMIAACVKWQAQGLGKPQTVANATENYLRMNDVLGEFIEDCLDIAQEAFSLSGAAYKRFSTYCADKGEKYVMSHRTFTQRLEVRGYPAAKVGGQRIYRGFALRSGDADPGASERSSWMRDD